MPRTTVFIDLVVIGVALSVGQEGKGVDASVKPGRVCVYCGQPGNLTDEHVIPDCFQKAFEAISIAKTPTGDKAIPSAQKVHDVCARCNNGPLSQLDNYLCALDDEYFSARTIRSGDCIHFQYDFALLLRVLLKIGYNVARTRNWPLKNWRDTTAWVLGCAPCPPGVRVFLQLLIPTPAKKINLTVSPGTTEVTPLPWHADLSTVPGLELEYSISFWSYRFFVLREDMEARPGIRERVISRWLKSKNRKGTYDLTGRTDATVYASSVMVLDALKESPTFLDQLAKARKLKSVMDLKKSKA